MREYLRYYWTDFLWVFPILGIIVCGCAETQISWFVYADLIAAFAVLVLLFNPFRFLSVLSFNLRFCIAAVITLSLSAVQLPLDYVSRGCLFAVVVLIAAVAVSKRKQWIYMESVKQSSEVDTVLAHLSYEGFFQAGDAWSKHGCAETRALLHQAAGIECPEDLVNSAYYAVYCLAWLHGASCSAELQEQLDKQEEELERLMKVEEAYKTQGRHLAEAVADRENWEQDYERLRTEYLNEVQVSGSRAQKIKQLQADIEQIMLEKDELTDSLRQYEQEEPTALLENPGEDEEAENPQEENSVEEESPDELPLKDKVPSQYGEMWDKLTRDQKIMAYNDAGMGYTRIGELFGLSKSGVQSAIRRERGRMQEKPA